MTRKAGAQDKRSGNSAPHPAHRARKRPLDHTNSIWQALWKKWFPSGGS